VSVSNRFNSLHEQIQMGAPVGQLSAIVGQVGVHGRELIRAVHVKIVVDPPIHVPDPPGRVEQSLQHVRQDHVHTERYAASLDGPEHGFDHVRRLLKDVGPDVVQQVEHGILTTKALDAQNDVFGRRRGGLSMHEIAVLKRIGYERRDCVDIVLGYLVVGGGGSGSLKKEQKNSGPGRGDGE
jgi:hypothetical protein